MTTSVHQITRYEHAPQMFPDDDIHVLHQAGLAHHRAPGHNTELTATDDVRYSLLLDDEHDTPPAAGPRHHTTSTDICVSLHN